LQEEVRLSPPRNGPLRWLLHLPVYLYRFGLGRLIGGRFLLLTHTGRLSGRRHETLLEIMEYWPGPEFIVMSGFGRRSQWLRNVEAASTAEITVGARHFPVTHRILGEEEAARVIESYEKRNRLIQPAVSWTLTRLLGWRYNGTEEDHKRLVHQLPLVAFRRRPSS
jgi:deazaflavin-dependent oxidoreductase (nitroreductase family)